MKRIVVWLLLICSVQIYAEIPIAVIVPSYNNARWLEANLTSIYGQQYDNYRVIYIDDCSSDGTGAMVVEYVAKCGQEHRTTVQCNATRVGALENIFRAVHSCADWELVVLVDGDDWLAHPDVFARLNQEYGEADIWLTYGQFLEYPYKRMGFCDAYPQEVIKANTFRKHGCPVSHLRTFYAWLFKKIAVNDLLYEGEFYPMTWDKAMMLPMLEMAGGRFKCIADVLYIYNFINPINDCKVNGPLQAYLATEILSKEPYQPLSNDEIPVRS